MPDSAPLRPQEAAGEPKAAAGHLTPQTVIALPAPPERPVESPKPNGAAPPAKRRGGRPKGSRNPDKLAIRRWMSPKAKKLTLKQIRIAHEIFDAALAGDTVTDARLSSPDRWRNRLGNTHSASRPSTGRSAVLTAAPSPPRPCCRWKWRSGWPTCSPLTRRSSRRHRASLGHP